MVWKLRKRICKFLARFMLGYKLRRLLLRLAGYRIGADVFVGEELIIKDELGDRGMVSIGDRVAIADRVTLTVSSHSNFSRLRTVIQDVHAPVVIEDDAWIGTCSIILPGVKVGRGAVVGAGAVVTKSIPEGTVVVGNPARPLKVLDLSHMQGAEENKHPKRRSA